MELQEAHPSSGFALSGPRRWGLSRAWLGGEERVSGRGGEDPRNAEPALPPAGLVLPGGI